MVLCSEKAEKVGWWPGVVVGMVYTIRCHQGIVTAFATYYPAYQVNGLFCLGFSNVAEKHESKLSLKKSAWIPRLDISTSIALVSEALLWLQQ